MSQIPNSDSNLDGTYIEVSPIGGAYIEVSPIGGAAPVMKGRKGGGTPGCCSGAAIAMDRKGLVVIMEGGGKLGGG